MKEHILSDQEVLAGYDAVCALYPHVPPLSLWRAWEYAAYQRYGMRGGVLDLGCGDGRYFNLLWPGVTDAVGIDMDENVAGLARKSGVYTEVHVAAADALPFDDGSFNAVFANCSLEHMDRLNAVLAEAYRCLKPGGNLLCSVVTDNLMNWSMLPILLTELGHGVAAEKIQHEFVTYHHLVNPLSVAEWARSFSTAGFVVEEHVPILPKITSSVFLLMDNIWHLKKSKSGELGDVIYPGLTALSKFPESFRHILRGLLEMEEHNQECGGAVFFLEKPR